MASRRVVITGVGVIAPNGVGKDEFSKAIFSGKSGVTFITSFDTSKNRVKIGGEIPSSFEPSRHIPTTTIRKIDRFAQLGLVATKFALEDAHLLSDLGRLKKTAVIIGSGQGGLSFHEQTILDFVNSNGEKKPLACAVPKITANSVSAHIAILFGINGVNQIISTACSSGAQAIGNAYRGIQSGLFDIAVTGGVEAPISPVMLEMYCAMTVLGKASDGNPAETSRPFDSTRNGFVLSEGAGILILESLENALQRHTPIYAEVAGFGSNCGAYHMVTPQPTGEDAAEVMRLALEDANIGPEKIDYINAHGTSTKQNDLAETKAIKAVFGQRAYKIPVSSIKSMIGHTIGAAGAIEAVACCLCIQDKILPPTINLKNPDPDCDLDYVPNKARESNVRTILSNSFGFGSNNAALIFREISGSI